MKLKIKTHKIVVTEEELDVPIPEQTSYYFETGVRRSIRIKPVFITEDMGPHKKGELYNLEITCVYLSMECKAERFIIPISNIPDILKNNKEDVIYSLCNNWLCDRTKEQFEKDLEFCILNLKS